MDTLNNRVEGVGMQIFHIRMNTEREPEDTS